MRICGSRDHAELGLREACLEIYADDLPAIAVYRACGFSVMETREGVLYMARRLQCAQGME